ncbi:hypothetical protein [Calidithermus chliarophilus]|uniref:hypothetical protein n=1 Tax=Calidithermus chliarophilus TaxID=52023 RepID=UPI0012F6750B|nr:hypothetical protein [Calidithermus chliarophilus]
MSDAPIGQVNGKDVYGRVRITDDDIQGHGMQPHANFELVTKVVRPDGKVTWQVMDNKHIIFSNKP